MDWLDEVLTSATREVTEDFFLLPIDGQASAYRERVYCYELYHRMRCHWPGGVPHTLNGEVDKAGHRKLRELQADTCKPDLLVHEPGHMEGNFAVIEVKPGNAPLRGLRKDLATLGLFSLKVGYQRAIYLLYGEKADAAARRVAKLWAEGPFPQLEIWMHHAPGAPAVRVSPQELLWEDQKAILRRPQPTNVFRQR